MAQFTTNLPLSEISTEKNSRREQRETSQLCIQTSSFPEFSLLGSRLSLSVILCVSAHTCVHPTPRLGFVISFPKGSSFNKTLGNASHLRRAMCLPDGKRSLQASKGLLGGSPVGPVFPLCLLANAKLMCLTLKSSWLFCICSFDFFFFLVLLIFHHKSIDFL